MSRAEEHNWYGEATAWAPEQLELYHRDRGPAPGPAVKVFRIEIYAPSDHSETKIADRWFTRKGAETMDRVVIQIIEKSGIEIPVSDLEDGKEWTAIGYQPR